jgi:hypothetical protein
MLESIQASLASGAELTREQIRALELRGVSKGALARLNTEQLAIWFGILVLIVVEVGLITPPVGHEFIYPEPNGQKDTHAGNL